MGDALGYPTLPDNFVTFSSEEQARWAVQAYTQGAEAYSQCEINRTALIDWINE